MGRRIALADDLSIYAALSSSFLFVGMVAIVIISATLCGIRFRKRSEPKPLKFSSQQKMTEKTRMSPSPSGSPLPRPPPPPLSTTITKIKMTLPLPPQPAEELQHKKETETPRLKELPLPPAKQLRETVSSNNCMKKSASTRSLTISLSMKMPRSLSLARHHHQDREDKSNGKKNAKLKHEDSIWMKTIILGEKCKVPDEDEDEAIIYDGKGNRIPTYHPKTSSSKPVSRQNSQIDPNAIPSQDRVTRKEELFYLSSI